MGKIIHELKKVSGRLLFPLLIPSKKTHSDKILLLKNDSIGDFLLFSGILNFYVKRFGEKVYCLVNNNVEGVASLYTENIIPIDNKKYFASLSYRYDLLNRLNDMGFGTAVNSILNSSVSRDILHILKIPTAYLYGGMLRGAGQWEKRAAVIQSIKMHDENGRYAKVLDHERHYLERILNITVSEEEVKPFIPLKDSFSKSIIDKFSIDSSRYFAISLGSGSLMKNYPADRFMEIIGYLHSKFNIGAVVLGQEKNTSIKLPDFAADLRNSTSLIEALGIIKHARLFVGNDTGITHASWIMGVPTVMIIGGGHFGRFLPMYDNGRAVYKHKDCYGCDWKCMYKDVPAQCIGEINTADIVKSAEELLS
ncbi:MAG: glycosyltransferase family 9 protein [Nitrospinae bacterium]|nr:glycosyltransferase family 9 protein [Nitrospinota bacterium]